LGREKGEKSEECQRKGGRKAKRKEKIPKDDRENGND
jgi:hypothetical protein